jgi:hypothetical protein
MANAAGNEQAEYFPTTTGSTWTYATSALTSDTGGQPVVLPAQEIVTVTGDLLFHSAMAFANGNTSATDTHYLLNDGLHVGSTHIVIVSHTNFGIPIKTTSTTDNTCSPAQESFPAAFLVGNVETSTGSCVTQLTVAVTTQFGTSSTPTTSNSSQKVTLVVEGTEEITVKAGTFSTVRLATTITVTEDGTDTSDTHTAWYAQGVGLVKFQSLNLNRELTDWHIAPLSGSETTTTATITTSTTTTTTSVTTTTSAATTTTTLANQGESTATLAMGNGWNLLGSPIPITDVATTFKDSQKISSVWSWDAGIGTWRVFLPGEIPAGAYATGKGFISLESIGKGEGFWVNSKGDQALTVTGLKVTDQTLVLGDNWNLKGVTSATPVMVTAVFNDVGKYASVWKWSGSTWSVFIPEETAIGAYAASKGFATLSTLSPGEGFWINVKPGHGGTINIGGLPGGATVGRDGGTVVANNTLARLDLAPRAVLVDTEMAIAPAGDFPPDSRIISGTVHDVVGVALPFNNRALLTLTYDPLALPVGGNADDLVVGQVIDGAWQPVFGALVDPDTHTVSVPVRQGGTFGVLNGKRVNSVIAYVVSSPLAANQFGDLGAAVAYVCQNLQAGQHGGVVIHKTPVTLGTLNLSCDVEIKAADSTSPTIDGSAGGTINTGAPVIFVGIQFTGTTTINTGDDLTLANNTFGDLYLNLGAATGQALNKGMNKSAAMSSLADGCFAGNTLIKNDTVAGALTLGGGLKVCGDTSLQLGEISSLVADGTIEFAQQAKLDINGPLLKSISAEAKYSGSASTTVASIHGNDISSFKLHLMDGDIKLNQLDHDVSGTVTVKTDGPADFTLTQDKLTIGGKYFFDAADMDVSATTHYFASMDVTGDASLGGGGTIMGRYLDTTFSAKFLATMGVNAKKLSLDQFNTKFAGEVRHNLLTDQAEQTLDVILQGNGSTTYEKGIGACISTGASAMLEYSDSIVKNFGVIQLGLSVEGKKSCTGANKLVLGPGTQLGAAQTMASTAVGQSELIVRNMVYPDQSALIGMRIKDLDLPVTIRQNQVKGMLLGLKVVNVSKKVVIDDNTIDSMGGVELAALQDATYSNNHQTDDTGLTINVEPIAVSVLSHITVTGNTFGPEGVLLSGPFGSAIVTATGNTLYGAENGPGSYMGLSGNNFTGGDVSDPGGGFFIDPGKGNNSGIEDEYNIFTDIDWTGNGCADYPPSSDEKDAEGLCLSDGITPPVLPLAP